MPQKVRPNGSVNSPLIQQIPHPYRGVSPKNLRDRTFPKGIFFRLLLALLLSGCRSAPPPSVLLIVVDTLRADHVGVLQRPGDIHPDATPRIDRFANGAAVFRQAYTPAPFTMPAMAATMTGAWPDRSGVIAHEPGVNLQGWRGGTLAEAARRSGLATFAVVANPWLARTGTGFDHGFDEFTRLHHNTDIPGANSASAVTNEAIRFLDGLAGRRFLIWVHYFDPHMPYAPPAHFAEAAGASAQPNRVMADFGAEARDLARLYRADGYSPDEIEQARRLYEGEVRYVDDEIGRLLDRVNELGLSAHTIVVVASDHGEALGEHGLFFSHDYTLYNELLHTPLIVKGPGVAAGNRDNPVSLIDLEPTICRLASLACEPAPDGRNLLDPPDAARTLFAAATPRRSKPTPFPRLDIDGPQGRWTMALQGGAKLVRMPLSQGTGFEMYDLSRDPDELRNLIASGGDNDERQRKLAADLDEWMQGMDAARPPANAQSRSRKAETRALRSLGYLQ